MPADPLNPIKIRLPRNLGQTNCDHIDNPVSFSLYYALGAS